MTTLTAAWSPSTPTAALVEVSGAADGPLRILRTDRNGTAEVRGVPDAIGGVAVVTDFEPALTGSVTYTLDGAAPAALGPFTGAAGAVLSRVGAPVETVTAELATDDGMTRETGTTLLDVLDAAAPVAVLHPLRTRTGTLELVADTAAEALRLADLGDGAVVQLRHACDDTAPLDTYLVVTAARPAPRTSGVVTGRASWRVTLDYREVARPVGDTQGAGWTWSTVTATYRDWVAVGTFASWRELVIGPRS